MKKENQTTKETFLKTLSSMTPEEVTELILKNSKIKTMKNVVTKIKNV